MMFHARWAVAIGVGCAVTRDSAKAVYDDAVEVFINPCPDASGQVEYQLLTNSLGKISYHVHTRGGGSRRHRRGSDVGVRAKGAGLDG